MFDDAFSHDLNLDFAALPTHDIFATPDASESFALPDNFIGEPGIYIPQTTEFTCAVVSQEMILRQFGIDVSEAKLVYEGVINGWLGDYGTAIEDVGKLLDFHGVNNHMRLGATVDELLAELIRGHKVITAVDSGELWGTDLPFSDWLFTDGADHALVVTGLDLSDPNHPQVYVNDPGDPNGAGKAYPLDHFLDAWSDSGNMYVATDAAPPNLAEHPILGVQFNAATGQYADFAFWEDFAARLTSSVIRSAVETAINTFTNEEVFGEGIVGDFAFRTLVNLTDAYRNELLLMI